MRIRIFTDGGARGNPGPAAAAFVAKFGLQEEETDTYEEGFYLGTATNNQAEYRAVIAALGWVKENFASENLLIDFFLDSQLIVEQLKGRYKLKNEGLKPLFGQVRDLISTTGGQVSFTHISREQNKEADRLVNATLDGAKND